MESFVGTRAETLAPELEYQPPAQPPLQNLAVNVWGWGIPLPACVDGNKVIFVRADFTLCLSSQDGARDEEKALGRQAGRCPFFFKPGEVVENAVNGGKNLDGSYHYLLVGFALPYLSNEYRTYPQAPGNSNISLRGAVRLIPNAAAKPLAMVVVPLTCAKRALLYTLYEPSPGCRLCAPYFTERQSCFYLPRYRDEAVKSVNNRMLAWSALVRSVIPRPLPDSVDQTALVRSVSPPPSPPKSENQTALVRSVSPPPSPKSEGPIPFSYMDWHDEAVEEWEKIYQQAQEPDDFDALG